MSDDEDLVVKRARVHYGSLATADVVKKKSEARQEKLVDLDDLPTTAVPSGQSDEGQADDAAASANQAAAEQPSTSAESGPMMELDMPSGYDAAKEEMMSEFARRRKARALVVPTDDMEVKILLRRLDEPICLFGEDKPDRRERLRERLSKLNDEEREDVMQTDEERVAKQALKEKQKLDETTWYHEGPAELRDARLEILKFSLRRTRDRLERARQLRDLPQQEKNRRFQETARHVKTMASYCSQFSDSRPISYCKFSPNGKILATSSWSGLCKLWDIPSCEEKLVLRGHNEQASCVEFHPGATVDQDPLAVNIASCCHAGKACLWNMESETPLTTIDVCSPARVSRVAFHPSGRFLAACCHDVKCSWRLFDVDYCSEILFQEGHSRSVYCVSFQADGSVAATGGLDGYGRVWDLRTGKCIMFLEGHTKGVVAIDWSPNGYVVASGSQDNTMKIWDLRNRSLMYTVPAHSNLVSGVCFDKRSGGDLIYTCSYDKSVKVWSHPKWQPLREMHGHDSRVMAIDVTSDGSWLASSSFDKTFKLWSHNVDL